MKTRFDPSAMFTVHGYIAAQKFSGDLCNRKDGSRKKVP